MEIITSTTVDSNTIEETLPSFRFVYNEDGLENTVTDKDLNSEEACIGYANREFLLNGTDIQTISFTTYARGLSLNGIVTIVLPEYNIPVDLSKNKFIVKEVQSDYIGSRSVDLIKGVRYD